MIIDFFLVFFIRVRGGVWGYLGGSLFCLECFLVLVKLKFVGVFIIDDWDVGFSEIICDEVR